MWIARRGKQFWNQTKRRWVYLRRWATLFSSVEVPAGLSCLPDVEVFDLTRLPKELDADLRYFKKFHEHLPKDV